MTARKVCDLGTPAASVAQRHIRQAFAKMTGIIESGLNHEFFRLFDKATFSTLFNVEENFCVTATCHVYAGLNVLVHDFSLS